jgi:hypothetical protein
MATPEVSLDEIEVALHRLPPERYRDVLLFVRFLEQMERCEDEKQSTGVDPCADMRQRLAALGTPAQPESEEYDAAEEFLKAIADL